MQLHHKKNKKKLVETVVNIKLTEADNSHIGDKESVSVVSFALYLPHSISSNQRELEQCMSSAAHVQR